MKLFELRPRKDLLKNDNPWEPWYDKTFGFVVRAKTAQKAREYADEYSSEENDGGKNPWLHEKYSTCNELTRNGDECIIMADTHSA
jgi:hypothetical protein